jgi:hypothetical protein
VKDKTCLNDEEHDWVDLLNDPLYNQTCTACCKKARKVPLQRPKDVKQRARERAGSEGIGY